MPDVFAVPTWMGSVSATRRGLHRINGNDSEALVDWKIALDVCFAGRLAGRKEDLVLIGNV